MLRRSDLHEYQKRAVEFLVDRPHAGLFLGCGIGKTIITLTAITDLIDEGTVNKVLVIAPKKVAESTWTDELARWNHLSHLTASVILGTAKQREEARKKEADIYITSRDNFFWLTEQYTGARGQMLKTKPWPYDMVVIDELTSFKSSSSKRFKAFRRLRPHMQRVVGLTGTPTPNGLVDLWAQMYCIDMGRTLGTAKKHYLDEYFNVYEVGGIQMRITLKPHAQKSITDRLKNVVLTMRSSDYLTLPPLMERDVMITLPDKAMAKYKEFERDCVLEFRQRDTEDAEVVSVAANAAVLAGKLLQYANGALYEDREIPTDARTWRLMHDAKLDKLMTLIESAYEEGDNVLVFYQYLHDAERIIDRCKGIKGLIAERYEDGETLYRWNAGKINVLLAHPASTAYGLNMQRGGHIAIWFGTGWNAELYEQGNARLYRQGQGEATVILRLVCEGTMDERAMKAVKGKIGVQDSVLAAMRELSEQ